jgi:hypothetical protein
MTTASTRSCRPLPDECAIAQTRKGRVFDREQQLPGLFGASTGVVPFFYVCLRPRTACAGLVGFPGQRGRTNYRIGYYHIIDWLVRKPGAFANYRYREHLFPSSRFRMAYMRALVEHGARFRPDLAVSCSAQTSLATGASASSASETMRCGRDRRAVHGRKGIHFEHVLSARTFNVKHLIEVAVE